MGSNKKEDREICSVTVDFDNPFDEKYFYSVKHDIKKTIDNNQYFIGMDFAKNSKCIMLINTGNYSNWKGKVSNVLKQCTMFEDDLNQIHTVSFIANFSDKTIYKIYDLDGKAMRREIKDLKELYPVDNPEEVEQGV